MVWACLIWLALSSAGASRIQTHDEAHLSAKLEGEWGASCDSLQNRFHTQVHTLREALDARTSESAFTQARLGMRMHAIIRTIRRAQECAWVVENDSEDIEEMHGILQELLAENPCAEAARSELEAGASTDSQEALPRAISILLSDDCEAAEIQPLDDAPSPEAQLQQQEESLQDAIDEIMTADEEGDSLIQLARAGGFRSFMRAMGVAILLLFMLLACVAVTAFIVGILALVAAFVVEFLTVGSVAGFFSGYGPMVMGAVFGGGAVYGGLPLGLVGCGYQTYTRSAPRLTQ